MKKVFQTLCVLLFYHAGLHAQTTDVKPYHLLWEIKAPLTSKPSYLFGTMHVTDERAFHMPDSVLLGIQNTDGFALEVDFDSASYLFLEYLYAAKGSAIFDKEAWADQSNKWETKPQIDPSDIFKVFDHDQGHKDETTFLDAFLYRLARAQGKTISGLEALVGQLELMGTSGNDAPEPSPLSPSSVVRPRMRDMIVAYEQGDLETLNQMVNASTGTTSFFKNEVIIKRNYGMAERADSLIHLRPTFIGVGAAHLLGDEGVIALLRKRGYRLRPVIATYTGMAEQARKAEYVPRWTTFQRAQDGYRLKVPARPFALDILDNKIKMYLGMDFPGGIVYSFYALQLPTQFTPDKIESLTKSMAASMGEKNLRKDEMTDITHQGVPGKEFRVKKDNEHLRIRLLFDKQKMYMLLLGTSTQVIESQAANDWFNSLELFEPIPLTQHARHLLHDETNGFTLDIPDDYDYEPHQLRGFPHGESGPLYNKYELEDAQHGQVLRVLIQDFPSPGASGELGNRLEAGLKFMANQELEPLAAPDTLHTDGVLGLGATYEFSDFRYHVHCYLSHNRMYVIGLGMRQDDPDSLIAQQILGSLHFLPRKAPHLGYRISEGGLFTALLPSKPTEFNPEELSDHYAGRIDSIHTYYSHDPQSSFNATIEVAHVWEYYAGTNAELLETASKVKGYDPEDSVPTWIETPAPQQAKAPLPYARYFRSPSKDLRSSIYVLPLGNNNILIGKIQTPLTAAGDAASQQFAHELQANAPSTKNYVRPPRLTQILATIDTADSEESAEAAMVLGSYRLQPTEYEAAIATYLVAQKGNVTMKGELLFAALLQVSDSTILPQLQQLYRDLPRISSHRILLLASLMTRTWAGAETWAIDQLRLDPTSLDFADASFTWEDYLSQDSSGQRLENLAFLLSQQGHDLLLASSAATAHHNHGWDYSRHDMRFSQILEHAIAQDRQEEELHAFFDGQMHSLLLYFYEKDAPNWVAHAHQAIKITDGYLPSVAIQLLLEAGIHPSTKEVHHVMSIPSSRDNAFQYYLDAHLIAELPAKYRKPDFIAKVAFDMSFEDERPSQVELIERQEITWDNREQWLYIYRFAYEGDRDWSLGFSGPIPQKGLPQENYFPLSGTNYDDYTPSTYKKYTKRWIKEATPDQP